MPSESMLEKLKTIEEKFEEIGRKLCDPDIVSDIDTYTALLREHKSSASTPGRSKTRRRHRRSPKMGVRTGNCASLRGPNTRRPPPGLKNARKS